MKEGLLVCESDPRAMYRITTFGRKYLDGEIDDDPPIGLDIGLQDLNP